jgi:chaperonin GroES
MTGLEVEITLRPSPIFNIPPSYLRSSASIPVPNPPSPILSSCQLPSPLGVLRVLAVHPLTTYNRPMSDQTSQASPLPVLETVEPIGKRVLIRKDQDKKQTKSGIHLPDKMEIPTLTGRVVEVSAEVDIDSNYPIQQYDRVLFNPKEAIPVDFEGDNRLFVVPVENIVAVFRKAT